MEEKDSIIISQDNAVNKTTTCLNCGTEFEGNFCPQCGQNADTKRFTIRFIFQNLLKAILSNDGGVWITLKSLFTRPGAMVVEILNGKRKSYFSPFPMLFLTLSLYVIIFSFTGSQNIDYDNLLDDDDTKEIVTTDDMSHDEIVAEKTKLFVINTLKLYANHYTAAFILTIPVYILAARVCFGRKNRKKYNWGEYCIPIVYSLIMLVLYRCVMSIVYYFSPAAAEVMGGNLLIILTVVVFAATFRKMFDFGVGKMLWRSFLLIVFYWIFFITLAVLVAAAAAAVFFSIHPEYLG